MGVALNKDEKAPVPGVQETSQKSWKTVFNVISIISILILIGGGAYYFFINKQTAEVKTPVQVFLPLDVFTVNLKRDGDASQYLQVAMTLQVLNDKDVQVLKEHMPEVRNRILFILSAKSASEIMTVDGKNNLINEIIAALKKPFSGSQVEQNLTGVYFISFIIQ